MKKTRKLSLDLEIRRLTKAMLKGSKKCNPGGYCPGNSQDELQCTGCSFYNPEGRPEDS